MNSEASLLRKEVIQPHLPIRLPCYDFTPVTSPTFDGSPPALKWTRIISPFFSIIPCPLECRVGSPASGVAGSRGVTGGVYKARERIHRGMLIRDY